MCHKNLLYFFKKFLKKKDRQSFKQFKILLDSYFIYYKIKIKLCLKQQ